MTNRRILMLALMLSAACKREDRDEQRRAAVAIELPPLVASSPTAALPVAGFGEAVAIVPVGATRPAPVLVAVLGIGDSPEEQCATWREIVGARAFVLCPRGAKHMVVDEPEVEAGAGEAPAESEVSEEERPSVRPDGGRLRQVGFYPVDVPTLDREVAAGLAALKARWGAHVSDRDVVYAGFSRGAFLGASFAAKRPERFSRVILIEGGQSPWQPDTAAAFARGGGKRVLFVCGRPSCVEEAEPAAATLREHNLEVRVVHGVGEGHGYRKQVKEELRRSFDWITEGDATWQKLAR
jgi:pimeloyl-ACP methyl ester carboxylesterase